MKQSVCVRARSPGRRVCVCVRACVRRACRVCMCVLEENVCVYACVCVCACMRARAGIARLVRWYWVTNGLKSEMTD